MELHTIHLGVVQSLIIVHVWQLHCGVCKLDVDHRDGLVTAQS